LNESQVLNFVALVMAYVEAHEQRMPAVAANETRTLWASPPLGQEYRAALRFVQELPIVQQRYAPATIEELVDDVLKAALQSRDSIESHATHLAAVLNHDLRTRMYFPLNGVGLLGTEYDVGAITLVRMDDETFEERIVARNAKILQENLNFDDAERQQMVTGSRERLRSLRGRVCAEITTSMDIPRTEDFARRQLATLCDYLQFLASLCLAHDKTLKISWATNAGNDWRHAFAISDGPGKRSRSFAERSSPDPSLVINDMIAAKVEEFGLQRIADLVGRSPTTEYDEMLQRSVRWFAKGEREEHPDDRKLSYITAIDLFFSQRGRGATSRICKGFAFALAEREDAIPSIARYMLDAFASRSETSHEGQLEGLTDEKLDTLRWLVRNAILAMLRRPLATKKDIRRWTSELEAALPETIRAALREATDVRRADAERCILVTSNALRALLKAQLFDEARGRWARALVTVVRDGARAGGVWVADMCPLARQMAAANDSISLAIERGTPTKRQATIYLNTVVRTLSGLAWIQEAFRRME
jgi:hypothetical protein